MDFNLDTRNILVLIITVLNFAIGFLVYTRNRKNITNIYFFIFALIVGFWGGSMVFFRSATAIETAAFFSRELYFWAALIPLSFIYFIYTFPVKEFSLKFWQKYILPIPALIIVFFSLKSDFLIETVTFVNSGENQIIFNKFYHTLYIIYMIGYFNYAYLLLFRKFFKKEKGTQRSQIGYVIIGTLLTTLIGTVTNLLGPYFGYFELNWFGQIGLIAMIGAIAYAILKYQLFNIKLILVELAILLLNLFLFLNVFTSHGTTNLILNVSIFVGILLFSVILIRGIYKDIRDREQIEELAYEMQISNEKLQMMEGQKTEFVSIASHQLRTPLTVIKGYASMILEGTFGVINDRAKEAIEKLYKSSERIVSLVEDLLVVSRLEQGRLSLQFEPINLVLFMKGILAEEDAVIRDAGLGSSFTADSYKEFWSPLDERRFKQVIKHILANAVQYTGAPGVIHVTISEDLIAQKNRIAISDTGVGMTPEQIRGIFDRFDLKVDALDKEGRAFQRIGEQETETAEIADDKKAPGIGLYIAQEIVHAHNGILHIESAGINNGTTFIIELPRVLI